jgi:hypothetical protein
MLYLYPSQHLHIPSTGGQANKPEAQCGKLALEGQGEHELP